MKPTLATKNTPRAGARAIVSSRNPKKKVAKHTTVKRKAVTRTAVKQAAPKSSRPSVPKRGVAPPPPKGASPSSKVSAPPRVTPPRVARGKDAAAPKRKLIPGLNRERRTIQDDDDFGLTPPPSPPSSLDLDRTASSARSGRRELRDKFVEHTETGPAITGGDIDADWESAYSVGDEAPGGDNPTPDQDIVDDIGRAVGVEYQDNEELKGEKKISDRDKHRWELDPASAEDYDEH